MSRMLLNKAVIFTAGAVLGSVVTWKLLDAKYKKIADEEIASVKEAYSSKPEWDNDEELVEDVEESVGSKQALKDEYINLTDRLGYTNYSDISKSKETEEKSYVDKPYVISPEEYGELEDYEQIELLYYADGVLVDDMDEPVEDVDNVVGLESLKTFGTYEDDAVHVRNDTRKCDYEILRSLQNYSERNRGPHPMEG